MNWFKSTFSGIVPKVYSSSGPYDVGVFDYEWVPEDFDFKAAFSTDAGKHISLFPDSLSLRCYYPGIKNNSTDNHVDWLPEPKNVYAEGYGSFVKVPSWASRKLFGFAESYFKMPAYYGIDPIKSIREKAELNSELDTSADKNKTITSESYCKLPVAIFSHGLAGNRTTYSAICREMASYGVVVLALEHRDGSASASYLATKDTALPYHDFSHYMNSTNKANGSIKNDSDQNKIEEFGPERLEFQQKKLNSRVREIYETVTELHRLSTDVSDSQSKNSNLFHKLGLSTRLDFDQMVIVGHSFGSASALEAIDSNTNIKYTKNNKSPFKAAIVLDPWMFAVDRSNPRIEIPTLIVRSEHFLKWEEHYVEEVQYFKKSFNIDTNTPEQRLSTPGKLYSVNIYKAGHQYFSDLYLLFPWVTKLKNTTFTANPERVISLTNEITIEFLRKVLDTQLPKGSSESSHILDNFDTTNPEIFFD
ncbi:Platelet-activating factor acetylhydrolase [Smittium culicis]|uniref:Putative phospholipase n=1 Tax=Smittium culicis TaxID=133412 RepID=A0A1R1Y7M4_9FUNG|nr:Platelet-activating factor acetylhydrolase [Smittium culicis]